MKIFVTGGTGFIGSHTVRALAGRGYELMLLIRDNARACSTDRSISEVASVCGDLADINGWKYRFMEFRPDAVLHLAWEGLPDYGIDMCMRNLNYGLQLFRLAGEAGCKCVVATGSCWEYAHRTGGITENSPIESSAVFPAAKNSLRIMGEAMSRHYGMHFYWPRLFFVYGPGQRATSLIPSVIISVEAGREPEVRNPESRNDFIYITDVADAVVWLIEKMPEGIVYNVGSGNSTSVSDIISAVYETMGIKQHPNNTNKRPPEREADDFWADIGVISNDTGWSPKYNIRAGIKATVDHYNRESKTGKRI